MTNSCVNKSKFDNGCQVDNKKNIKYFVHKQGLTNIIEHCQLDALISLILFYASELWGIDCNGQLGKDPAELVQNKFLKWLLGVNKYCNNNACRAETGRFPMRIEAQCRNLSSR